MIKALQKSLEDLGYEKPNLISKMPDQVRPLSFSPVRAHLHAQVFNF